MAQLWKWLTGKPLQEDSFLKDGRLSVQQFKKAGDHLCNVCTGWTWQASLNPNYVCQYLDDKKQFLLYKNAICKRRIRQIKDQEEIIIKDADGEEIIMLKNNAPEQEEIKNEDIRYYNMYIVYDEYYHCPRMSFTATDIDGKPVSNQQIRQDIQKEYLDETLTVENFPFMQNVRMATVHPCKHANVLKSMSDTMRSNGQLIESHFALLIFMKFIPSVIPHVQFDAVELHFK